MTRSYTKGDLVGGMESLAMGYAGSDLITDTSAHAGDWDAIQVIESATFTTLTTTNVNINGGGLATASDWGTLSAGTVILGNFTNVQLTSGAVQLFKSFSVGEV
jgi:hypothetical protein